MKGPDSVAGQQPKKPKGKVGRPRKTTDNERLARPVKSLMRIPEPVADLMRPLTPRQRRFVTEFVRCGEATKAARLAGYSHANADEIGPKMMKRPWIKAAIDAQLDAQEQRTLISSDGILRRLFDIATADPGELIRWEITACRYCHGIDHEFQWRDEREFEKAYASALAEANIIAAKRKQAEPDLSGLPTDRGGYGFKPNLEPHEDCPHCAGRGDGRAVIADLNSVSPQARKLYAGMKITKEGIEIKMHDQMAALDKIAKHLGMYGDDALKREVADPLRELIQAIQGRTLRPVPPPVAVIEHASQEIE